MRHPLLGVVWAATRVLVILTATDDRPSDIAGSVQINRFGLNRVARLPQNAMGIIRPHKD
jgi:hypothetical protein